jgi:hypothetical protein
MVTVHWYGGKTGWTVLTSARWLALVTIVAALVLVASQATRPAPALPVTMSVIVTVLGLLSALWLLYRVAVSPAVDRQVGAWLGLASAGTILVGGFLSMRQEGVSPEDEPREIVTVKLPGEPAAQR